MNKIEYVYKLNWSSEKVNKVDGRWEHEMVVRIIKLIEHVNDVKINHNNLPLITTYDKELRNHLIDEQNLFEKYGVQIKLIEIRDLVYESIIDNLKDSLNETLDAKRFEMAVDILEFYKVFKKHDKSKIL